MLYFNVRKCVILICFACVFVYRCVYVKGYIYWQMVINICQQQHRCNIEDFNCSNIWLLQLVLIGIESCIGLLTKCLLLLQSSVTSTMYPFISLCFPGHLNSFHLPNNITITITHYFAPPFS